MRVLVKMPETGRFYAGCDQWVQNPELALDFQDVALAREAQRDLNLTGSEVTLAYEGAGLKSRYVAQRRLGSGTRSSCRRRGPLPCSDAHSN